MSSRFRNYGSIYGNSHNRNRTRIDTRPQGDEAVAAGMRNIHRDTSGNVIGGTTAEGVGIGTKSRFRRGLQTGGGPSRLDAGPQTPGLDRLAGMQRETPAPSFAEQEKAARERSAASGAFGKTAQNLSGRRSLFRDMQAAGGGGITPDMEKRAASLGVKPSRFRSVASSMSPVPAGIAKPTAPIPAMVARPQGARYDAATMFASTGVAKPAAPPMVDKRMAKR